MNWKRVLLAAQHIGSCAADILVLESMPAHLQCCCKLLRLAKAQLEECQQLLKLCSLLVTHQHTAMVVTTSTNLQAGQGRQQQ